MRILKELSLILPFLSLIGFVCGAANAAEKASTSTSEVDAKIAQLLTRLNQTASEDSTKTGAINNELIKYLKSVLSNPAVLSAVLPKAKDAGLTKLVSDDAKVCFYSWDSQTGGSMHFFNDFAQWKSSKGVKWRDLNPHSGKDGDLNTGYFFHNLYSVLTADGRAVYLPTSRAIYSGPDHSDEITAYAINAANNEENLVEIPFFKTKKKLLKTIKVPAVENEWNENGLIKFKDHNKTLLIPITVKDGGATGRFLTYRFNGHYFVFDEKAHEKPDPRESN